MWPPHAQCGEWIWTVVPFFSFCKAFLQLTRRWHKCNSHVLPMREQLVDSRQDKSPFSQRDGNWNPTSDQMNWIACRCFTGSVCRHGDGHAHRLCSTLITPPPPPSPRVHIVLLYNFVIEEIESTWQNMTSTPTISHTGDDVMSHVLFTLFGETPDRPCPWCPPPPPDSKQPLFHYAWPLPTGLYNKPMSVIDWWPRGGQTHDSL